MRQDEEIIEVTVKSEETEWSISGRDGQEEPYTVWDQCEQGSGHQIWVRGVPYR